MMNMSRRTIKLNRRRKGLSLVELLIALTISSVLLTATMVATDACFKAYASAAESASAQSATRMVTQRLLTLIRTSTAHGPVQPDADEVPPVVANGEFIDSWYLELIDPNDRVVRIEYRSGDEELWAIIDGVEQPLLGGVEFCEFSLKPRTDRNGVLVLERATMAMQVRPDADATLALERGPSEMIEVVASTMPRKLD